MKHCGILILCCLLSMLTSICIAKPVPAKSTEEFPVCEVLVEGKKASSRSSYEYYYRGVDEAELNNIEITFNLTLDAASTNDGSQIFALYLNGQFKSGITCDVADGPTCLLVYSYSLPQLDTNDDDIIQVNKSPIIILSDGKNVCFMDILYSEKSVEIKAQLDWIEYDNDVYELIVDIQQGFPQPTVGPVLCDGVVVDGLIPTKRGGYIVPDVDILRNSLCKLDISNEIDAVSLILPVPPRVQQKLTPSPDTTTSSIFIGFLIAFGVIIVLLVAFIIYKRAQGKLNINNIINMGQNGRENQVTPDGEVETAECLPSLIPDHQPPTETATSMDNLSTLSGDAEVDGAGTSRSSSGRISVAACDQRPIPESDIDIHNSCTTLTNQPSSPITSPSDGDKFMLDEQRSH